MTECSTPSLSKSQEKSFSFEGKKSNLESCICRALFRCGCSQTNHWIATKTKNKQTISSFCSLNLYIKCNVRSYQYSTCQCVSPVSFQRSPWRWCQHWMSSFVFYLNMKFFHRSAIFNFSRGQSGRCTNIYFSMYSQVCITYRSCYVTFFCFVLFFLWGCSPATVAELRDDSKMWSGTHTHKKPEWTCVFLHWSPWRWNSCTDKLISRPAAAVRRSPTKLNTFRLFPRHGASPRCSTQTTSKLDPADCIGPL